MSRLFDDASSQYLEVGSVPVNTAPMTIGAWFYTDANNLEMSIAGVFLSSQNDWFNIEADGSGNIRVWCRVGGTNNGRVSTSSSYTVNTWQHACGVFTSDSSRSVFLNGGSKATNTDSLSPIGSEDVTSIGRRSDGTPNAYWSGRIAEVGIWNVALTDDEVSILAEGYSPLLVRPESLVFYAPLIRDEDRDLVGGLALTDTNSPTIAVHPRVIYPSSARGTYYTTTDTGITIVMDAA